MPPITQAVPTVIFALIVLSLVLVARDEIGLTSQQTVSLIVINYVTPGVLCVALALWYRQPLIVGFNISALVFLTALAGPFDYSEMLGATMVAGLLVALIGVLGLSVRIARILPPSIVFGMLGGLVLPYLVTVFTELENAPLLIGGSLAVYLLSRRVLDARIPPILPTTIAAFVIAGFLGELSSSGGAWSYPGLVLTTPAFSLPALINMVPVLTVLVAVQGNLAAAVYLRHQEYRAPERAIDASTGVSSAALSFFGAGLISMASMLAPLTGGPEAGKREVRYWSVVASGTGFILIGLAAGIVVTLGDIVPMVLLMTLAGVALIGVLSQSLQQITRGPLLLGPLFAFAITLSELSIFGLGSVVWALVIGTGVSVLLEGHRLRAGQAEPVGG